MLLNSFRSLRLRRFEAIVTGGLEFALACDLLVAAESTKLGDTHGQWVWFLFGV